MWPWLRVLWLSSCVLLLAACGTHPIASGTYTVKSGDTLYSIAQRYGVEVRDLAKFNNVGNDYRIYPGQVLRLSQATAAARAPTRVTAPNERPIVIVPPSDIKWSWPTNGTSYAATTRPNGGVGLVINGRAGQDIKTAAAGRVVYTGSGLLGYGQLIIVKHDDVFLSAYGHAQTVLVHEGDQVAAGQTIATMGAGPTGAPMLYFEIRVNGQPTDPLLLLRGQQK